MSDAGLVHILDDDPGVRAGLSSLVRSVGYVASLYGLAGQYLASEPPGAPFCLLSDVRPPGTSVKDRRTGCGRTRRLIPGDSDDHIWRRPDQRPRH